MEAAIATREDVGVPRETVMAYVWQEAVEYFARGELDKARSSFGVFECLEAMSDDKYEVACTCDKEECACHMW